MVDTVVAEPIHVHARVERLRRIGRGDSRFHAVTLAAAVLVLLLFIGVMVSLTHGAWLSIKTFGFSFLVTQLWNPVTQRFGALAPIFGTFVTSILAMALAVPVGIGIAIFLTELCPEWLKRPVGIAVELLAGIPSIIYGIWGLFIFAPWFSRTLQPWLIDVFGNVPILSNIFAGPPYGIGVFTASLILSIMILPFIAAVTRDVFQTVPPQLKESAYALGCTTSEVVWNVVLPFARTGVVGGSMLALGRALGETMAVTFVIGNAQSIGTSLFSPGTTISSAIANEFSEAVGDVYLSALVELGLILFFITFVVLAIAQLMLYQLEYRAGGKAR